MNVNRTGLSNIHNLVHIISPLCISNAAGIFNIIYNTSKLLSNSIKIRNSKFGKLTIFWSTAAPQLPFANKFIRLHLRKFAISLV